MKKIILTGLSVLFALYALGQSSITKDTLNDARAMNPNIANVGVNRVEVSRRSSNNIKGDGSGGTYYIVLGHGGVTNENRVLSFTHANAAADDRLVSSQITMYDWGKITGVDPLSLIITNSDTSLALNEMVGSIEFQSNDNSANGQGTAAAIRAITTHANGVNQKLGFYTREGSPATGLIENMTLNEHGDLSIVGALDVPKIAKRVLLIDGDSISNSDPQDWPYHLDLVSKYFSQSVITNFAEAGDQTTEMVTEYASEAGAAAPGVFNQEYFYFIMAGINDVAQGTNATTAYSNLQTLWSNARADGYKVVAFTVIRSDAVTGAEETERQTLNKLIMSDPSLYDYVVRPDLILDPTDDASLFTDQTHPNEEGSKIIASLVARTIFDQPWRMEPNNGGFLTNTTFDVTFSPGGDLRVAGSDPQIIQLRSTDTQLSTDEVLGELQWYASDSSSNGEGVATSIKSITESTGGGVNQSFSVSTRSGSPNDGLTEKLRVDSDGSVILTDADTDVVLDEVTHDIDFVTSDASANGSGTAAKIQVKSEHANGVDQSIGFLTRLGSVGESATEKFSIEPDGRINMTNHDTSVGLGDVTHGIDFTTSDASGGGAGVAASIEVVSAVASGVNQTLRFNTRQSSPNTGLTAKMDIDPAGFVTLTAPDTDLILDEVSHRIGFKTSDISANGDTIAAMIEVVGEHANGIDQGIAFATRAGSTSTNLVEHLRVRSDGRVQLTATGKLQATPSSLQTLAAGSPVVASATKVRVAGSGGAVTITATPSIADGEDGQIVFVQGTDDTNTLTLQDESGLGSSNLQLGAASRVLGQGDILQLMFDATDSFWYEVTFADN